MKLNYYPETDSRYITLSEQPSVESLEISEGVLIDYDADSRLGLFSFRLFVHFIRKVAIRRSLLQRKLLD